MKNKRLFVGGLPWSIGNAELKALFEDGDSESGAEGCGSGTVEEAIVISDRDTGKSKGFGFVAMVSLEKAGEAVKKFNNFEYKGRSLKVDEAADQAPRRSGGGGGDRPRFGSTGNSSRYDSSKRRERY